MLSIPNKEVLQINSISITSGAGIADIVQYKHINKQTIHPRNPHTLLLLKPLFAVNIFIKKSFIIFYLYFI
jgi:hypothetical protein